MPPGMYDLAEGIAAEEGPALRHPQSLTDDATQGAAKGWLGSFRKMSHGRTNDSAFLGKNWELTSSNLRILFPNRSNRRDLRPVNDSLCILLPSSAAGLPCLACDFTPLLGSELCQTGLAALAPKFAQIF